MYTGIVRRVLWFLRYDHPPSHLTPVSIPAVALTAVAPPAVALTILQLLYQPTGRIFTTGLALHHLLKCLT